MSTVDFLRAARGLEVEHPDFGEQMRAAFYRENTVSMLMQALEKPDFTPDENFNALDHLTLPELQDDRLSSALMAARSREELDYLRRRNEQLRQIDAIIDNGPVAGLAASLVAGVLDPINFVPLGWAATGLKASSVVARAAITAAAGQAITEPFRYAADPFRTTGDTLFGIVAAGGLGAGLGGVAVGIRSLASNRSIAERIYEAAGLPKEAAQKLAQAGSDAFTNAVRVVSDADAAAGRMVDGAPAPQSLSAARAVDEGRVVRDVLRDTFLEVGGPRFVRSFVKFFGNIPGFKYPGASLISSESVEARKFAFAFADTGILSRAAMNDVTDAELRAVYRKAVERGYQGAEDDFIAAARAELQTGLSASEAGTWQANYSLMRGSMLNMFSEKTVPLQQQAVSAGLVRNGEEFAEKVGEHLRFLEEPEAFNGVSPLADTPDLMRLADEVAKAWRETIAKPMLKEIKESGIWKDQPATLEAIERDLSGNYFPKVFDREAIAADPNGFAETMKRAITGAVEAARSRLDAHYAKERAAIAFSKDFRAWQKSVGDMKPDTPAARLVKLAQEARAAGVRVERLKAEIAETYKADPQRWLESLDRRAGLGETLSAIEVQLRDEYTAAVARHAEASQAYNTFRKTHAAALRSSAGLEPPMHVVTRPRAYAGMEADRALVYPPDGGVMNEAAIKALADDATKRILNNDPALMTQTGLRAYLRMRQAYINPNEFLPYIEKNVARVADRYVSTVARDVALQRVYGTYKAEDIVSRVYDEMMPKINEAMARGDKAAADRLTKEMREVSETISTLVAIARGQFDQAKTSGELKVKEAASIIKSWTFMTHMGAALLAQIGDITTTVLRYGVSRVFSNARDSIIDGVTKSARGLTKEQLMKLATATEMVDLGRMRLLYDIAPPENMSWLGRKVEKLTNVFSRWTLMPAWNDYWRRVGVRIADDMLTEAISSGKMPDDLRVVAAQAGINAENMKRLQEVVKKYRTTVDSGAKLWDSNLEEWILKEPELAAAYRRLLHITAQRMIIQPGALDSPIWTQKTIGSMFVLFKRFVIASIPQQLIPWLQTPSGRKLETMLVALSVGTISTVLRDLNRKGEVKERSPAAWVLDALDMSGLLSALTEADATLDTLVPGLGVKRMLTGEDYTRMQERFWIYGADFRRLANLGGPVLGLFGKALTAASMPFTLAASGDVTEAQVRALREIIPFHNNLLIRHGADVLEQAAGGRQRSVILNALEGID